MTTYKRKNHTFNERLCRIADSKPARTAVKSLPAKHRKIVNVIVAVFQLFRRTR